MTTDPGSSERDDELIKKARAQESPESACASDARTAPAIDDSVAIPETIGRYRILSRLGAGGMGVVYLAEQEVPKRQVALKLMRSGLADPQSIRRFEHEVELLGRLQHPGIAQIFEAGTADSGAGRQPYFAMELIHGWPLLEYVAGRELGIRSRLLLFTQICDGVEHAHQKGIIHRDLKPPNILITAEGRPKILDFGVARATGSDVQATTMLTDVGQLIGTLPYMSPEQVDGDPAQLDTRSDVYALGVILYELLAGMPPYVLRGCLIAEAARVIKEDEPMRLSSVNKKLRGDLETIVARALEKEKERRYQSASGMASDIQHYLDNEPIAARPPTTWYQLSKFSKRNRALVGGLAATVVALLFGVIGIMTFAVRAEQQRSDALAFAAESRDNYRMAHEAIRFMIRRMTDELTGIAGAGEIRAQLLEEAYDKYTALLAPRSDDPDIRNELAEALYKRAGVRLEVGTVDQAAADADQAQHILEQLVDAYPLTSEYARNLLWCHMLRAEIAIRRGEPAVAERYYKLAYDGFSSLVSTADHLGSDLVNLLLMTRRLGWAAQSRGEFHTERTWYEQAIQHGAELALEDPDDVRIQSELATAHERLGDWHAERGDAQEADTHYAAMLRLRDRICHKEPDNSVHLDNLAWGHQRVAKRYRLAGRRDEALEHYEQFRALCERLVEAEPSRQRFRENLARACFDLGDMAKEVGHIDEATELYVRRLKVCKELVRREPANPNYRSMLAWSHERLAATARARGELGVAYDHASKMVAECEQLIAQHGRKHSRLYDLATAYERLREALPGGPYSPAAGELLENRRIVYEELVAGDPNNRSYVAGLAWALVNEGRYAWKVNHDGDGRRSLWERAQHLYESLYEADRTQLWLASNVAWSLLRQGEMAMDDDDPATAADVFRAMREFAGQIQREDNADRSTNWLSLIAHAQLGRAYNALGRFSIADEVLEDAHAIGMKLLEREPSNPVYLNAVAWTHVDHAASARALHEWQAEKSNLARAVQAWCAIPSTHPLGEDDLATLADCMIRLAEYDIANDESELARTRLERSRVLLAGRVPTASIDSVVPRMRLAKVLINNDQAGAAHTLLQRAFSEQPWLNDPPRRKLAKLAADLASLCKSSSIGDPANHWTAAVALVQGRTFTGLCQYAEAEASLLRAYELTRNASDLDGSIGCNVLVSLAKLYAAWNEAQPDEGYGNKAAEWQAELEARHLLPCSQRWPRPRGQ